MSSISEIKAAIGKLPEGKWQEIKDWLNTRPDQREFSDDGFDIEETKTKLQAATCGSFRKWTDDDWQRLHDSVK